MLPPGSLRTWTKKEKTEHRWRFRGERERESKNKQDVNVESKRRCEIIARRDTRTCSVGGMYSIAHTLRIHAHTHTHTHTERERERYKYTNTRIHTHGVVMKQMFFTGSICVCVCVLYGRGCSKRRVLPLTSIICRVVFCGTDFPSMLPFFPNP